MANNDFICTSSLENIIYGMSSYRFFFTYVTSILSASLGLAKCLKYGVARPIRPGGSLDGLFTGRFVLAFISSALCLIFKSVCLGFLVAEVCIYCCEPGLVNMNCLGLEQDPDCNDLLGFMASSNYSGSLHHSRHQE